MDPKKTSELESYIATLTEEERSRFSDLITECRHRDDQITKDIDMASSSAEKLDRLEQKIMDILVELDQASQRLLRKTASTYLTIFDNKEMYCS